MRKAIVVLGLACFCALGVARPGNARADSPDAVLVNSVSGAAIVQTAVRYVGYRYTTVGNAPATGFSCIGYVSYVYQQHGIPLPDELSLAQSYAPAVPFSNLLAGDVLFFQNTVWTGLSHTAIYLGAGRFVHAEWYNRGVRVSSFYNDPVDGDYWIAKYLGATRPWSGSPGVIALPPLSAPESSAAISPNTGSPTATLLPAGSAATVIVPSLNLRAEPSRQATVLKVLKQGSALTVIGRQGDWYQVRLGGSSGWVIAAGIDGLPSATATVPTPPLAVGDGTSPGVHYPEMVVSVDRLRVHSAPGLAAPVTGILRKGQTVIVLTQTHSWDRVRAAAGTVGWVSTLFLSSHAAPTTAPPTPAKQAVIRATVRVHRGPAVLAPIITIARRGTAVVVVKTTGNWLLVRFPAGITGYVLSTFVQGR